MSESTAVLLLNFGEPEEPSEAQVVPFLERIFYLNAQLEPDAAGAGAERARQLARERAPGLIAEYASIGGSPLNAQARAQADALARELERRGNDVIARVAMQFTPPGIAEVMEEVRSVGVTRVVALPVYPLCGPSTTVASLETVAAALGDWDVELLEISGWHLHPDYIALRAGGITATAESGGVDLHGPSARLVFSAHGTPMKYIRQGSRYDLYVEDCCNRVAQSAGIADFVIGYQNHANRPIEWTQPSIERVVESIEADDIVVVPISFMHEQSETLAELDHELRELAEARGLGFHRVPIPHLDPSFISLLADLVETRLGTGPAQAVPGLALGACRCRTDAATRCTNYTLERLRVEESF